MSKANPIDELRAQVSTMLDTYAPEIPISTTVVVKVIKAKEDTFIKNATALTEATRKLPGCNLFAYHKLRTTDKASEPAEFLIYEDWETTKLFRTQWDSEHLKSFQYSVVDLIAALPELKWYYGWSDAAAR